MRKKFFCFIFIVMLPARTIIISLFIFIILGIQTESSAQDQYATPSSLELVANVEPQPLLAQALRLNDALSFLGSALSKEDAKRLKALQDKPLTEETSTLIQNILDAYCLALVCRE